MAERWIDHRNMQISIIVPCLNESETLKPALIHLLSTIKGPSQVEIILSDGGSDDDTLNQARQLPVTILNSTRGRAVQMNNGAAKASGEWLVFLHADTRLPDDWVSIISACRASWGRFDVRLSGQHRLFRVIESSINLRSRLTSVATGDQVLFFRRNFFEAIQGFPEIPLMEDIAISKKARKLEPPACIRRTVITSSRRWEKNGIVSTILLMWVMRFAYWIGIKPERLHRYYYS